MAYITLNKNNFFNNLNIIVNQTKSIDKVALVLKDNAYGHGLQEVATMAKEYGITKAVVRTCEEAQKIEEFFEYILVLGEVPTELSDKIRYTINDIDSIKKFPRGSLVELKVDTGMHRNGVAIGEVEEAVALIKKQGLTLEAAFTHHRSADELSSEWFWQNSNFKQVKQEMVKLGYKNLRYHSANSAALFRTTEFSEDMARVGIVAYGCIQLASPLEVKGLKPVLSLYAKKISSRRVKSGEGIGYGATYFAKEECVISNYDFGYADGFLRVLSNNYFTPKGLELVGRISMDNSSFISDTKEILIFEDARVMAKYAETIGYEILTSLKKKLKREIV